jgi:hypothetical protein
MTSEEDSKRKERRTMQTTSEVKCFCIFKHANTPAERTRVGEALAYARSVGDSMGAMMAIAMLANGECPGNLNKTKKEEN